MRICFGVTSGRDARWAEIRSSNVLRKCSGEWYARGRRVGNLNDRRNRYAVPRFQNAEEIGMLSPDSRRPAGSEWLPEARSCGAHLSRGKIPLPGSYLGRELREIVDAEFPLHSRHPFHDPADAVLAEQGMILLFVFRAEFHVLWRHHKRLLSEGVHLGSAVHTTMMSQLGRLASNPKTRKIPILPEKKTLGCRRHPIPLYQ